MSATPRSLRWLLRGITLAYAAALVAVVVAMKHWGAMDLMSPSLWPMDRYAQLASPLSEEQDPQLDVLRKVHQETAPQDSVLAFPCSPQFYALLERKFSGRMHGYYAGVFDKPDAQRENLEAIRKDMPALVILPSLPHSVDRQEEANRVSHAYLESFLRQHFTYVLYDNAGLQVLARTTP